MAFKIFLGMMSVLIPLVGLFGGLYYLFFDKKAITKQTKFAIILMILTIPTTLTFLTGMFSSSEEVTRINTQSTPASEPAAEAIVQEVPAITTSTSTPSPVPTSVSLQEILDLRDANEVAADAKYIGMYVSMEGEIIRIQEKYIRIIPLRSDEYQILPQLAGATCSFDESQMAELIQLRKGQWITIVGIIKDIDDLFYNDLDIKPCTFK